MLSRNGICYELRESPYVFEWGGITYHFSSQAHRAKFIREIKKRELWLNDSLSRRFKVTMHMNLVADLQLYSQIESRGFYVVTNDGCDYTHPYQIYVQPDMQLIGVVRDGTV